jgi:hypothetical protein
MCILGLVLFGISMQKSSRKDIVKWQIFSFLLYATQYFLLGAYLGMLTYLINMIRSIVFFHLIPHFYQKHLHINYIKIALRCTLNACVGLKYIQ